MKLQDFADLSSAQTHIEVGARMVSPDMMIAFLATFSLMPQVMAGTDNEALALHKALDFGSEFNFINGHPSSVAPLLSRMVASGLVTQEFSDYCIAYANPTTTPFANSTEEEFQASKVAEALYGTQNATSVTYMGNNDKHIKLTNEDVRLTVRLDVAATVDTTVDFTLLIRNTDDQEFSPVQNWIFTIVIPAGSTTATREITNTNKLTRHTQFTAKSNVLNPFTVEVTGA